MNIFSVYFVSIFYVVLSNAISISEAVSLKPFSEDHYWEKQESRSRVFNSSEDDALITSISIFPLHVLEIHFNEKGKFEGPWNRLKKFNVFIWLKKKNFFFFFS